MPRFCWLDLRLHASLYSMYGVPVSIWDSRMANQSCWALTVFGPLPSARTARTAPRTPRPCTSIETRGLVGAEERPLAVSLDALHEQIVGPQAVEEVARARLLLAVVLRRSRKSKMSACHGSR